jgi:LemA protein
VTSQALRYCWPTRRDLHGQFLNPFKITGDVKRELILVKQCRYCPIQAGDTVQIEDDPHPVDHDQSSRAIRAYADKQSSGVEAVKTTMKPTSIISILFALLFLAACGINPPLSPDNDAKAAFADVQDLYHARLDLVTDAMALARKHLSPDSPALTQVDAARAAVVAIHTAPDVIDTPASFERYDVAQRQLTEAISQLMIACEAVRGLRADPRFRAIQARLASSAGRIAFARDRYDEAARRYNASRHRFPLDLADAIRAERDKPTFLVPDGPPVHRHPRTDFGALRGSLRV